MFFENRGRHCAELSASLRGASRCARTVQDTRFASMSQWERTVAKTHKVTFKKSGITLDIAEDEYILEEAEDAGLRLPYDCRSGTCTACIQKCLEGEIDQDMAFAIGDEELEQGLRLICIGSPLSDVVLDA